MNIRTDPKTQDTSTSKPTGCCGGKTQAQPKPNVKPQISQTAEARPAKSGCCCGRN